MTTIVPLTLGSHPITDTNDRLDRIAELAEANTRVIVPELITQLALSSL